MNKELLKILCECSQACNQPIITAEQWWSLPLQRDIGYIYAPMTEISLSPSVYVSKSKFVRL